MSKRKSKFKHGQILITECGKEIVVKFIRNRTLSNIDSDFMYSDDGNLFYNEKFVRLKDG